MIFKSREEAGRLLAKKLKNYGKENCLVLAIPRGGVVIGAVVAKTLSCALDVIITRKLGAPGNPELAIGATTSKGGIVLDRELIDRLGATQDYIHREHRKQLAEARRREKLYSRGEEPDLAGKTVILVDDGIATGATIEAAIAALREGNPKKMIIAVPVAPPQAVGRLKHQIDDFVVLSTPESFLAIGEFYSSFPQVSDEEVVKILKETNQASKT
jgi:putative phosphoribosyl transferase